MDAPLIRQFLALVIVAPVLSPGCASGEEETYSLHAVDLYAVDVDERPLSYMQAEAIGLTELFETAVDRYVASCMRERGFDYEPRSIGRRAEHVDAMPPPIDAARTALIGYGQYLPEAEVSPDEPTAAGDSMELTDEESDAFGAALFGGPDDVVEVLSDEGIEFSMPLGGCLGEGRRAISRTGFEQVQLFHLKLAQATYGAAQRASTHPQVLEAKRRWRRCMASAGFDVVDREHAIDRAFAARLQPSASTRPTMEEIALATTDAACSSPIDVYDLEARARAAAEQLEVAEIESLLLLWAEVRPDLYEGAVSVLGRMTVREFLDGEP